MSLPIADLDADDLPGLAFRANLKRTATHFAICRKPLARDARVEHEVEPTAAERALNRRGRFHVLDCKTVENVASCDLRAVGSVWPAPGPIGLSAESSAELTANHS